MYLNFHHVNLKATKSPSPQTHSAVYTILPSTLIHKRSCSHHREESLTYKTFGWHKQQWELNVPFCPREMVVGWLVFYQLLKAALTIDRCMSETSAERCSETAANIQQDRIM